MRAVPPWGRPLNPRGLSAASAAPHASGFAELGYPTADAVIPENPRAPQSICCEHRARQAQERFLIEGRLSRALLRRS